LLIVERFGARSGSIIVFDQKGRIIEGVLAYAGEVRRSDKEHLSTTVKRGLAGWVRRMGQATVVEDTATDGRWFRASWQGGRDESRTIMSVPLLAGDTVIGVLSLANSRPNRFRTADLALLGAMAVAISNSGLGTLGESMGRTEDDNQTASIGLRNQSIRSR